MISLAIHDALVAFDAQMRGHGVIGYNGLNSLCRDFEDEVEVVKADLGPRHAYGVCQLRRQVILLDVNLDVSQEQRTLIHEVAHWLAYKVYGDRGHGRFWRRTMRWLGDDGWKRYVNSPEEMAAEEHDV